MNTNKIRSWCTVDEKGNIVALCASRVLKEGIDENCRC